MIRFPAPFRLRGALAALLAMPWAALAQDAPPLATCRFTTECYETDACSSVDFRLTIASGDTDQAVRLVSDAETVTGEMTLLPNTGETVVIARGATSFQLLSVGSKHARYTLHLAGGPLVVTYHGTCESP